jgi:hypothetical protein
MLWALEAIKVIPVDPHAEIIEGDPCYPSLSALPEAVDGVVIVVPPSEAEKGVRDAAQAGIRGAWMQQGAESQAAIRFCEEWYETIDESNQTEAYVGQACGLRNKSARRTRRELDRLERENDGYRRERGRGPASHHPDRRSRPGCSAQPVAPALLAGIAVDLSDLCRLRSVPIRSLRALSPTSPCSRAC